MHEEGSRITELIMKYQYDKCVYCSPIAVLIPIRDMFQDMEVDRDQEYPRYAANIPINNVEEKPLLLYIRRKTQFLDGVSSFSC